MAKTYATFSITDGEWKLVDGPDGDYQKHRKTIMDARTKGTKGPDKIVMVNLKAGIHKEAKKRHADLDKVRAERAAYRESLKAPDDVAEKKPAKKKAPAKKETK